MFNEGLDTQALWHQVRIHYCDGGYVVHMVEPYDDGEDAGDEGGYAFSTKAAHTLEGMLDILRRHAISWEGSGEKIDEEAIKKDARKSKPDKRKNG